MGSYVWSHLTSLLRSEDPAKQTLVESLPDDIISRDFEAEFLKYSSYSEYTVPSGGEAASGSVSRHPVCFVSLIFLCCFFFQAWASQM